MSVFPLATMMSEQVIAYVQYGVEKRTALVLLLALVFLLLCLPIAALIDLVLVPTRMKFLRRPQRVEGRQACRPNEPERRYLRR